MGGLHGAPVCTAVVLGDIAKGKCRLGVMLRSLFVEVQGLQFCSYKE